VTAAKVVIVWPGHPHESLLWLSSDGGDSRNGCMDGTEAGAGESLGGYRFGTWHAALVDAMHWAYTPEARPPTGWRLAFPSELLTVEGLPHD